MNAELLLQHYERIADAPDAIARLRRFVLDLAVRGKLVPQDPNDEPASALLKRITKEKMQLADAGKIRKPPALQNIDRADIPFPVPSTWMWVRVGGIFDYDAGIKRDPKELKPDLWLLELEDIEKETSVVLKRFRVSDRDSLSTKSQFEVGDILYGKLRPYLNKVVVADEPGYSTTEIVAIRPFLKLCPAYCALAFRRPDFVAYVERLGQGTKMPRLRTPDAISGVFPLAPIGEQHRIAAKVEELMALCDRLEAARAEREATRDRLTSASLTRLNAPDPDPVLFADHARFALDNLSALATRPDQIKQIRQTILNLAVRGKLVPQDAKDEPATGLLKRITAAKGTSRRPAITVDAQKSLYALPPSWKWAALDELIVAGPQNGISPRPTNREDAPKAITLTATTSGIFNAAHFKRVEANIPEDSDFWLTKGDLLFQRGNTREYVGIAAIYDGPASTFLFPDLIMKVRVTDLVSLRFVHMVALSPPARAFMSANASGAQATMPKINQTTLVSLPIPLPPFAEQNRIVKKVDALMALCDQLETSLTVADTTRRRLLEALLAEALAPVEARDMEAAQ